MAMTLKRAARMTGYDIRPLAARAATFCFGAFDGDEMVAHVSGPTEWLALRALVTTVYRKHVCAVLKEHSGRCARCQRQRAHHIHHRRYRSRGGTHEIRNLEPVCWDCHRLIHERERSE
jgi:hypothetical protein